jgi:hypothetical protein
MKLTRFCSFLLGSSFALACGSGASQSSDDANDPGGSVTVTKDALMGNSAGPFANSSGLSANVSSNAKIDRSNEFFQSLGTNGRACVTCHDPRDGFSISAKHVQELFDRCEAEAPLLGSSVHSKELDDERIACAIFRTNDGSNSPNADVSTRDKRAAAYNLLLSKGLIRIGIGVPPNADFDVVGIDDPYGFATPQELSLFRRPLPATNLSFEKSIMWDIRETSLTFVPAPFVVAKTLQQQLTTQADNANLRHAQAMASLTDAQLASIVDFELGLYSAQEVDFEAGSLSVRGATGGVENLSTQPVPGNATNVFGLTTFDPVVFTLFDSWAQQDAASKRASIARGQALFNTRRGPGINRPPFFDATGTNCGECHNSLNDGGSTTPVPTGQVHVGEGQFTSPDLPLYTLQCSQTGIAKKSCTAGQQIKTNDPGRALITGSWRSIDNFKVPLLRNLAARPPYFHDGSAATLADVVDFYVKAMQFQFTDDEKNDLVNFLASL